MLAALTAAVMVCAELRLQKYDKSKFEQLAKCERRTHSHTHNRLLLLLFASTESSILSYHRHRLWALILVIFAHTL